MTYFYSFTLWLFYFSNMEYLCKLLINPQIYGIFITEPMTVPTSLSSFSNQVPKVAPRATDLSLGKSVCLAFIS